MTNTQIFIERVNFGRYFHLHVAVLGIGNKWAVANPVTFTTTEDDAETTQFPPMVQFTPEQAQRLMDELWSVGLRPTQGKQSEGQMGATTRHLDDMRALVSALAKVQLP